MEKEVLAIIQNWVPGDEHSQDRSQGASGLVNENRQVILQGYF